ncbi:MAG: DUF3006 domain-containing protein [Firmicutes bacterium]|jgi:hypothetical protein|nr:DUF3006 domain-containing protein [Bacillota bacterium]
MRQSPCRQYCLWILPVVALSLTFLGCGIRQPLKVQVEPLETNTISLRGLLYTVDRIENHMALLLPRCQTGDPILVPYHLVAFAQEGDIICATGDVTNPYVPDEEATIRVQRDIHSLLAKLQDKSTAPK